MRAPIFILAGEPSGDQLAASIMQAVNHAYGKQDWIGVGGPMMQGEGLHSEADMSQLSIIGFGAAISAYAKLSRLADRLIDRIIEARPKAVITVDAKGFSLRLAARLKRRMAAEGFVVPIIHTVAPTVWAWGAWRAKSVARAVDGLLCLFPFEVDYFTPLGVKAHFIGHPEAFNSELEAPERRKKHSGSKKLLLLPGSRRSEIRMILPVMRDAVRLLTPRPETSLVTVPHLESEVQQILGPNSDITVTTKRDNFYRLLHGADAMMAASGTVTLQTALAGLPGVTCYKAPALTAFIGRRLVNMDRVILPNALLKRRLYPFLFQEAATPEALAEQAVLALAADRTIAAEIATELRGMLRGNAPDFATAVTNGLSEWLD